MYGNVWKCDLYPGKYTSHKLMYQLIYANLCICMLMYENVTYIQANTPVTNSCTSS